MAEIKIDGDRLVLKLSWLERIQGLRLGLSVPLKNLRGATADAGYAREGFGIRAPGAGLPGVVATGTFFKSGDKTFAVWVRGQQPVVIELANSKFQRLIVGCRDAERVAAMVNAVITS